ncbi:MAG: hypothetical protein HC794_00775 [Nitrospiraceae bacterium]|nr:hypothetical protein [Nitrospiraceae bacterium]
MMMAKSLNMGRPVVNRHKVPKRAWNRWTNAGKKTFNGVYDAMRPKMQFAFTHPEQYPIPRSHWETIRWNAAWQAAHSASGEGRFTSKHIA